VRPEGPGENNLPQRMDPIAEAQQLAAMEGRAAGTDAERRAAVHLRDRLRSLGRDAELQPLSVRPRFGLTHALHCLIVVVGSALAVNAPVIGTALVLVATISAFLDVSGALHVLRRLTGVRASQNVESTEDGDKTGVVILTASYDSPRTSGAFGLATRLTRDPWLAMLVSMAVVLLCCVLRVLGLEGTPLTVIQFIPTVVLILLIPALADVELSEAGADAEGAAAAATVLAVAEDLGGKLEHFDLWVLLTGARRPFALGMTSWLRRRRGDLDREATAVVSIGPIGAGPVRYTTRVGPLRPLKAHSELVRLSGEIAEDAGDDEHAPVPHVARDHSDAAAAIARGLPSLSISCAGAEPDRAAMDRARAFTRELIERLDAEVGPRLPSGG
jgi:hypothetical protein